MIEEEKIKLVDEEKEYKEAFYSLKRWSKHWFTSSSTRNYSAGNELREPAGKTLDFILSLNDSSSFKAKLLSLRVFLREQDKKQKNMQLVGTSFYLNNISYIKSAIRSIENRESLVIRKI